MLRFKYWRDTEIRNKCSLLFVALCAPNRKVASSIYFCCIILKKTKENINDLNTDEALKIKCSRKTGFELM
jgi:hypothetical protein